MSKKEKKERADKYESKLKIEGSLDAVLKVSVPTDEQSEDAEK